MQGLSAELSTLIGFRVFGFDGFRAGYGNYGWRRAPGLRRIQKSGA